MKIHGLFSSSFPFFSLSAPPLILYSQQQSQQALKLSRIEKECFVKTVARMCPNKVPIIARSH